MQLTYQHRLNGRHQLCTDANTSRRWLAMSRVRVVIGLFHLVHHGSKVATRLKCLVGVWTQTVQSEHVHNEQSLT